MPGPILIQWSSKVKLRLVHSAHPRWPETPNALKMPPVSAEKDLGCAGRAAPFQLSLDTL
jgi:hypothetical protein